MPDAPFLEVQGLAMQFPLNASLMRRLRRAPI